MDFITHGIIGGLIYSLPVKLVFLLFGIDPSLLLLSPLFVWGFIEGSWPDAGDWILYKFKGYERWHCYTIYHALPQLTNWKYFPVFMIHVKYIDPIFHKKPSHITQEVWDKNDPGTRNWFSWLWWLAMIYWAIAIIGVYVLFFV